MKSLHRISLLYAAAVVAAAGPAVLGQVDPLPPILPGELIVSGDTGVLEHGDFHEVESIIGQTAAFSLRLENDRGGHIYFGSDALTISSVAAEDYETSSLPDQLPPGEFTILDVRFTPGAVGPRGARLRIQSDSADPADFVIQLKGTGLAVPAPDMEVRDPSENLVIEPYDNFKLGRTAVGSSRRGDLYVTNLGTADLEIGEPYVEGSMAEGVRLVGGDTAIAPQQTRAIEVEFTANAAGSLASLLYIPNNATAVEFPVRLLVTAFDDCNENNLDDADEIADGNLEDCDADGRADDCEDDGDGDGTPDDCDQCPDEDDSADTNVDGIADCLQDPAIFGPDCDDDGVADAVAIADGLSEDCDSDGKPDDCEDDGDADGVIDDCDVCPQADNGDGDGDGVPDCLQEVDVPDIELDCDGDGIVDAREIASGQSTDCDDDGLPDDCEPDGDGDDVIDDCDRCPGEDDHRDADLSGIPDCLEFDVAVDTPLCGAGSVPAMMLMMLGIMPLGRGRWSRPRHAN